MRRDPRASTITEVLPRTFDAVESDSPEASSWLAERYGVDGGFVRLNMVATVTGSIAGEDGTSDAISSPTDRLVLRAIRAAADVVVVGAGTARAERYVLPSHARLAVVTSSGDLDGVHLLREGRPPAIVLSSSAHAPRVRERLGAAPVEHLTVPGSGDLEPAAIIEALVHAGLDRIVCEGGPTLATRFLETDALDEVCVTIAPALTPPGTPFVSPSRTRATDVAGMLVDDRGFSYLRLRVRDRGGAPTR
ncbi:dihydrofolate reductase family protein [Microbacterium aquimaris]|uniref:dihydrofolate reductase family protein n=1 Tax=Microbacterium aquimaris TaxID=459816 RepID=UPI002AD4373E|nr:dihydrofolate reductase family protein [Microbacterium aquimaris]MDZ8275999.1 dihydrofolate reductase family protein [Microbacterium aquimaris]